MGEKIDLTAKEFVIRLLSVVILFFIVSIIFSNFAIPELRGFWDSFLGSLGMLLVIVGSGAVIPAFLFFWAIVLGKKISKKLIILLFFICSFLVMAVIMAGAIVAP